MQEYNAQFQGSRKSCKTFNFCSHERRQTRLNPGRERADRDLGTRRFFRGARAVALSASRPPTGQHSPWQDQKELYVSDVAHIVVWL